MSNKTLAIALLRVSVNSHYKQRCVFDISVQAYTLLKPDCCTQECPITSKHTVLLYMKIMSKALPDKCNDMHSTCLLPEPAGDQGRYRFQTSRTGSGVGARLGRLVRLLGVRGLEKARSRRN